jgi:two-component system, NarL family, response regulator LiaR
MENRPIQVLIVDDHTMVRKGLTAVLKEYQDICVVGEAPNGKKAIELVETLKPDVVLIDLLMPVMDGIETIRRMIADRPDARIIVLTGMVGEDEIPVAIKAGAMGYFRKDVDPEELAQSIRKVYLGEPVISSRLAWHLLRDMNRIKTIEPSEKILSERELEVLRLLSKGNTDKEIANELFLTDVTIRTHISRIIPKIGVQNRVQAVLYGLRNGLVSIEDTNPTSNYESYR